MKTLKHSITCLFVFAILFIGLPQQAKAQYQPPDSCLKLPIGSDEYPIVNPDSVKVDSCLDSPTYGKYFSKKYILIFERWVYIFKHKPLQIDSLYTWQDIDSNHNDIKTVFQELENKFGQYFIIRPNKAVDDSEYVAGPDCILIFNNYICADTLINFIKSNTSPDSIYNIDLNKAPAIESVIENVNLNDNFSLRIENKKLIINNKKLIDLSQINLCIYDIIGNLLFKLYENNNTETIQIDISDLQFGLYIVILNNKYTYKLLNF